MRRVLREVLRIAREVPAFASRHKVWAGIVIVLALLAVVIYLPRVPFVGPRSGREAESEFRGHLLQALGGLVLAVGAYFTGRTFALNREGQITERFTRAVEQLADEKLDIRLGGIYALERIARDSETHYEPVMEVLTAFLREHTREGVETSDPGSAKPDAGEPEQASQAPKLRSELRADFQAAATVIGKRDRRHERSDYHLNLRMVRLQGASLEDARLERAALSETDLSRSYLRHAVLSEADLDQADLSEADLSGANLSHAGLSGTNLSGASVSGATTFSGAILFKATLADAILSGADFSETDLSWADLSADLSGANLSRADLSKANLSEAYLDEAVLSEADLDGADLSGADLSGATGLTHEQLAGAITDEETKLPEYLDREAGG
jgi:uncharacterized protein YjbI with pentapeptide repeats